MKKYQKIMVILDTVFLLFWAIIPSLTDFMLRRGKGCFSLDMGIICPACGGTRCINSLSKLDFAAAFSYNPAVFLGVFYFTAVLLVCNAEVFTHSRHFLRLRKAMLNPAVILLLAIGYIIAGFLRNFF